MVIPHQVGNKLWTLSANPDETLSHETQVERDNSSARPIAFLKYQFTSSILPEPDEYWE